jgi:hypothetical protein
MHVCARTAHGVNHGARRRRNVVVSINAAKPFPGDLAEALTLV